MPSSFRPALPGECCRPGSKGRPCPGSIAPPLLDLDPLSLAHDAQQLAPYLRSSRESILAQHVGRLMPSELDKELGEAKDELAKAREQIEKQTRTRYEGLVEQAKKRRK